MNPWPPCFQAPFHLCTQPFDRTFYTRKLISAEGMVVNTRPRRQEEKERTSYHYYSGVMTGLIEILLRNQGNKSNYFPSKTQAMNHSSQEEVPIHLAALTTLPIGLEEGALSPPRGKYHPTRFIYPFRVNQYLPLFTVPLFLPSTIHGYVTALIGREEGPAKKAGRQQATRALVVVPPLSTSLLLVRTVST